jgi:hypothetical protein
MHGLLLELVLILALNISPTCTQQSAFQIISDPSRAIDFTWPRRNTAAEPPPPPKNI